MKNILENFGNRTDHKEERIMKLKGKDIEIILMQEERKVRFLTSEETM